MRWVSLPQPFGRNLIKNPCGKEQYQHWDVQHGGSGWCVEENTDRIEGAEAQTCFVSSYEWCVKSQLVDLLKEGLWKELLDVRQPEILISDWWGSRKDSGCAYKLHVSLLAHDQHTVLAEFKASPAPIPQWNDGKYQKITHSFKCYGPGVRYVHFRHEGRDEPYWIGHYGARITNSTVLVKL